MAGLWSTSTKLSLFACLQIATATAATAAASLHWSPCAANPALDCATLAVPLEYADPLNGIAHVPIARFNATVPRSQRKGALLTNPGGPGSSGIDFLLHGAGEGLSNITSGYYDIISWDPRGVSRARPLLQCFQNAGQEAKASAAFPAAAEIEYSQFRNQSYWPDYYAALEEYDSAMGDLADACVSHNSSALYTSSAAYVARDMAAIADAVEGRRNATVNYWGFSYGTIFGAEFVQTFPERVGRVVFDGVFDAGDNSGPYIEQLPNDEMSVHDAIGDLVTMCSQAGPDGCAFTKDGENSTSLAERLASLQESLYRKPAATSDGSMSITVGIFSFLMYSFLKLPPAWPAVIAAVQELENGNADPIAGLLTDAAAPSVNASDPDTGSLAGWPLQCTDNGPSYNNSLPAIGHRVIEISFREKTPWLNADLSTLAFCRNFPNRRPLVPNFGASRLYTNETNAALTARNSSVLIVNALHDPTTPSHSAETLQRWLPTSSQLVNRRGPGHTTISLASLGLIQSIRDYLLDGHLPETRGVHDLSQLVFSDMIDNSTTTPVPVFNGSYTREERVLLESTYNVFLAFISLP
ncbi:hypothetical protein BDV18DRAFT_158285 [Aspergillus unguis]